MYLQKLEIQGFKSFAQKTVLEFNRELTAVVGPNGSGKSNIADAIRWVLGEQSVKLLRGKRAEDVIFAGSESKSRLGMAEVSLHLNNNDGGSLADYSEIIVTRRVYRDGQSEYLLNGESVRLQDILILLARANFGQKTYSVIGQGMVDSILLATPTERKEFFEEATGVKQYQLKREQAVQKLLTTYTNLEQGQALLLELEPNLRTLTRQVKRLEQRQELEQELNGKQKLYYRFRFHTLENERQIVVKQNGDITSKLQSARELSADLQERLKILSAIPLTQGIFDSQKKIDNLRSDLNQALREQAHLQAEAKIKLIERGEGEVAWLKEREVELSQKVKELKQVGENLQADQINTEKLLAEAI
ncbi:MAG: AAA family ATPase, partial [Patescibacteria group bacterium]